MNKVTQNNYEDLNYQVKDLSNSILGKMANKNDRYEMDIMTMITIANTLISVIKFLYMCYSERSYDILEDMKSPGFFQRILIKRQIRKHVDKDMVDDVYTALVEQAQEMHLKDVDSVLRIYKNKQMFKRG